MALKVIINSFSYKKSGIPEDTSGNCGGFVYDCRFINNPGRIDEFKSMTGLELPVIEFIKKQKPMEVFLKNVIEITDMAIDNYLSRGFSDLMISFGCTGGQHRSVYSAEFLNAHINNKYKEVITEIHHRDLDEKMRPIQ
ncbi:hypothetical protein BH10BAC5_BH10BAC5_24330 [soil metagenome]